ncbi:hypothetical protein C1H46_021143 [Malus baccata]|uniref:NAC domain-containing protein n=1 Tax=Malus baccata TaxID=106549 RepID=A0A540M3F8_MALBA|nr:hypothetical protein C1H46_021143 [Malus baccata]
MEQKNEMEKVDDEIEKVDDVMLPGFRFHPTDEELVGFYLKRKIQQRVLPIELIKQVDIYKYNPWDLPTTVSELISCVSSVQAELASTGEKEWYFYCPRDRKYKNSTRPNRVTGAGFWKATGTDRPIYSSEGSKCIGLKKSLVFYRGRAAKGIKTDWMMHEFRLPSLSNSVPPKKLLDKSLPANDSWAICRIFKKTNSMAQRALSRSWDSQFPEPTEAGLFTQQFSSENMSCTTDLGSTMQFWNNNDLQQASNTNYSSFDTLPYKPINPTVLKPSMFDGEFPNSFMFSPAELSGTMNPALIGDLRNAAGSIDFDGSQQQFTGFLISLQQQDQMQGNKGTSENEGGFRKNMSSSSSTNSTIQWGSSSIRSIGFPFSLA